MAKTRGLTTAGSKIVGALTELCEALEAGESICERFTVRTVRLDLPARRFAPEEVRRLRASLRLSQPLFAQLLGVGVQTIRSWEQGLKPPSPMACRFMDEMESSPDHWRARIQQVVRAQDEPTARA